ncbi:MAG TPA: hypothetical protein VF255_08395 [Solirubrobacterales bacterium]
MAAALAVALVVPAQALAEYYVPPENSAANQYTESFPGAGGEKAGKGKKATPADTLGSRNAKRLEERGPAGEAAAEVAAETAPAQPPSNAGGNGDTEGSSGAAGAGSGTGGSSGGAGAGGTSGASGGSSSGGGGTSVADNSVKVEQPQGSSGVGHVLGQATGVGDGNVGIWLPLVILLTLAGSIAYAARSRQLRHEHGA